MLKSRTKYPPGGWRFLQPQTGWSPAPQLNFQQTVNAIINHRQSNSRFNLTTDYDAVADELERFTEKRLRAMRGTEDWYTDTGDITLKKVLPASRRGVVAAVAGSVKRSKAGIKTILDWLGEGAKPVAQDLATARAMVCKACPKNQKGSLFQWIQARAAGEIHDLIAASKDMNLATPFDGEIEVCQACDCHLPLKVWVPLKHILKNTSEAVRGDLDQKCWIHTEVQ